MAAYDRVASPMLALIVLAASSASPSASPVPAAVNGSIDWPAWLAAIGTLAAVVVALVLAIWGDAIRGWRLRPKLDITIAMKPPDCIKIQTRIETKSGQLIEHTDTYYCRLEVWNHGNVRARNVQVTLLRLHRRENGRIEDPDFLPLSLVWSHVRQTVMPSIPQGLFRHVDLCHAYDPSGRLDVPRPAFELDTEVRPTELRPGVWPTFKGPGEYVVDLAVSADNAKPAYRSVAITFTGTWTADEQEMFANHLVVSVVPSKP